MKKLFYIFHRPTLKAKLIDGGSKVKVSVTHANAEKTVLLLYMAVKQIAKSLKVDHRHLINSLTDLDKRIIKNRKDEIKQAKYGKK